MKINLVSNLHESVWRREAKFSAKENWVYSESPVPADVYVVYGKIKRITFPSSTAYKIFVAIEPPEIFRYDLAILAMYNLVIAPEFEYMRTLQNRVLASGLLNWSIGSSDHIYNSGAQEELPSIEVISSQERIRAVSVIMSLKSITPLQVKRIAFVRELKTLIPELVVFGRDSRPIADKFDGLLPYQFHLAIENSIHSHYWTEKLSDPLLCLAKVFYVGDPFVVKDFDNRCVVPLDISDAIGSAKIVSSNLANGITESDMASLIRARQKLVSEKNLHHIVEEKVSSLTEAKMLAPVVSSIPAHRVELGGRLKFYRDEARLRIQRLKQP